MTRYLRFTLLAIALGVLASAHAVYAQTITEKQADEILKELRAIRQLLERQAQAQPPAPSAPPADERVTFSVPGGPILGRPDAPVTMVEYTDLECPFCHQFHTTTFAEIKKAYIDTGKVRFVSRDFPLGFHAHAKSAAIASRCAGEQGKYWEFRSVLASNADKLFPAAVLGYAGASGLDVKAFQACLGADKFAAGLQKDLDEAAAVGVSGTPTFVLGKTAPGKMEGSKIVGALPFAAFEQKINALLEPAAPPTTP
ncbi:MAG TPA: DsbA family protein, partial [Vicinamibacteria bacterium]|nr:DsbA family protein [Vicinamibacteria bacterium]